jgi:hypothetical protein
LVAAQELPFVVGACERSVGPSLFGQICWGEMKGKYENVLHHQNNKLQSNNSTCECL